MYERDQRSGAHSLLSPPSRRMDGGAPTSALSCAGPVLLSYTALFYRKFLIQPTSVMTALFASAALPTQAVHAQVAVDTTELQNHQLVKRHNAQVRQAGGRECNRLYMLFLEVLGHHFIVDHHVAYLNSGNVSGVWSCGHGGTPMGHPYHECTSRLGPGRANGGGSTN